MSKFKDFFTSLFNGDIDVFGSLFGKYFGTGLTGAEKEANQFTADQSLLQREWSSQEAERARDWNEEMYAKYNSLSGKIAQAEQSGVNPMFAVTDSAVSPVSPGASAPSGSSASSVSPTSHGLTDLFGSIIGLMKTKAEIDNIKADTDEKKAGAKNLATRLEWDATSFETNLSILKQKLESGELDLAEKRYNVDNMLPLLKSELESKIGLTNEQANLVYNQVAEAFNRAEKLAQEVQENRESWDDRKLSIASKAIVDDFEASAAKVVDSIGNGKSLEGDALLGSLISILKYFVVKK